MHAMATAVERHLALLRAAIEPMAACCSRPLGTRSRRLSRTLPMPSPPPSLAQRALQTEPWPDPPGPLQVRMALHAGEAVPRDGDYLAAPLNRLARLLAAGHGTQILLTEVVERLVTGALPAEVSLRPLGTHRLRDLHEPEEVFQLVAAELPHEFPPLQSLPRHPTNLTIPPTSLIGRAEEVAAILRLLAIAGARLVTLTGPGGTGKTRLALEIGAEALDRYPDGVFFVDLSPLTDPTLVVPDDCRRRSGCERSSGQPLLQTLSGFLTDKRTAAPPRQLRADPRRCPRRCRAAGGQSDRLHPGHQPGGAAHPRRARVPALAAAAACRGSSYQRSRSWHRCQPWRSSSSSPRRVGRTSRLTRG